MPCSHLLGKGCEGVTFPLVSWVRCGKDKEALFNIAYNVTDNISSRAILRNYNNFNRYCPVLLYLPSTTPLYASVSKGAASIIFYTFGMVPPRDSNPLPPAPKADALSTELSRQCLIVSIPDLFSFSYFYSNSLIKFIECWTQYTLTRRLIT